MYYICKKYSHNTTNHCVNVRARKYACTSVSVRLCVSVTVQTNSKTGASRSLGSVCRV